MARRFLVTQLLLQQTPLRLEELPVLVKHLLTEIQRSLIATNTNSRFHHSLVLPLAVATYQTGQIPRLFSGQVFRLKTEGKRFKLLHSSCTCDCNSIESGKNNLVGHTNFPGQETFHDLRRLFAICLISPNHFGILWLFRLPDLPEKVAAMVNDHCNGFSPTMDTGHTNSNQIYNQVFKLQMEVVI